VIVVPPRELDIATADEFREAVTRELATTPHVVVDLSTVASIDSAGLSTLLAVHLHAVYLGGGLAVVGAGKHAHRLFSITKVDELIPTYQSIDEVPVTRPGSGSTSS